LLFQSWDVSCLGAGDVVEGVVGLVEGVVEGMVGKVRCFLGLELGEGVEGLVTVL
jgi:hypothetical protein